MNDVTLAIICRTEDEREKLYARGCPSTLTEIVRSHRYPFSEIIIAHRSGLSVPDDAPDEIERMPVRVFESKDYDISQYFGLRLPADPPELVALWNVLTDYVVFSQPDCMMVSGVKRRTWIQAGIEKMKEMPTLFAVTPYDGDGERICSRACADLFLASASALMQADFDSGDIQFDFADRIARHMTAHRLYAYVLGGDWLYWKFGPNWQPAAWKKGQRSK